MNLHLECGRTLSLRLGSEICDSMNLTAASVILSLVGSPFIAMRRPYHIIRKFIRILKSHANIGTHFHAHFVKLVLVSGQSLQHGLSAKKYT